MHFEIHPEAKRMASVAGRILLFMVLGTLIAPRSAPAQSLSPQPAAAASATSQAPADISQLESDALTWLQQLLRINTTNPPGDELTAAKYIAGIVDKEGIHSEIFESAP